jgi:hypothetical protein
MDERFETFTEDDDEWFSDMELRVLDLEQELSEWRESRAGEPAEPARRREREREPAAAGYLREHERELAETDHPQGGRPREFLRATGDSRYARNSGRTSGLRTRRSPAARHAWSMPEDGRRLVGDRTQVLIDRGRRAARPPRSRRRRKIAIASAAGLVLLTIGAMVVFRKGPSWPPSVATVQSEITTACQNPNVVSEPSQVNFACGKDTSQILWVFALLTSNDDPGYSGAKTGRKGLEPIAPAQGGQIAWSLNLHHPYDPFNAIDSLQVAARAINNIIGGATVTGANGNPTVQPGLESKPENCARYTGSSAIISHAGFPSLCASPVTSREGQAALAADVYQQWMVGATAVAAQDVSVLFENASNPGDPQVQAILKTLPNPGR